MTWILIWAIMNSDGVTSGSQEFNSQEACEIAKSKMKKVGFLRIGINDVVECVNKWTSKM